jgi:capsid protein
MKAPFAITSIRRALSGALMKKPATPTNNGAITPFGSAPTGTRTTVDHVQVREFREPKPRDRMDAVKTSRFLRGRLGLVAALFENTSRYALTGGLTPSSMSGDQEWDMRADDYFDAIASRKEFDVREEHNFYNMQSVILPDMMCDGDCGAAKVRLGNGAPAIQLFPTEAIGNGSSYSKPIEKDWKDGIRRDKAGKKIAFRILEDPEPGKQGQKFRDYPASDFLHIGRLNKINLNRPLPWLAHGKDACVDILDLTALEKASARVNSYFAAAITTATGQAPAGFESLLTAQPESLATVDKDDETTTKDTVRHYAEFMGGANIPVLARDEELKFFRNDRPSVTFSGFIDWLVNDIAWGFGVPPQFVWSVVGVPGPQDILVDKFCRPVREGVIEHALHLGHLPLPKAGANWRGCQWQGPQPMSIDKGRDGKLFKTLVDTGMMGRHEWHEMSGKNGRKQRIKIIDELAEDIAYCRAKGVPLALYFGIDPTESTGVQEKLGNASADPENIADAIFTIIEENGGLKAAQRWG